MHGDKKKHGGNDERKRNEYNARVLVRVTLVHRNTLSPNKKEAQVTVLMANGIDA